MSVRRAGIAVGALWLVACGSAGGARTARTRQTLAELLGPQASAESGATPRSEPARRAHDALRALEESEANERFEEADEHASRARAWASLAVDEEGVVALEDELGRLEAERLSLEAEVSALDHAARTERDAALAEADARAAHDELERALRRAETDERTPRRARRVGLAEAPEVRRLSEVLEERARLLLAAARSLGAGPETLAAASDALEQLTPTQEPGARLAEADRAHTLARRALADARHRLGTAPRAEEIASLREALLEAGLTPIRDDEGLAVHLSGALEGQGLTPSGRTQLGRLAQVVEGHRAGPILIRIEGQSGDPAATRRLEAVRRALAGGPPREIVGATTTAHGASAAESAPHDAVRVVLPAYVPQTPAARSDDDAQAAPAGDGASAPSGE